MNLHALVAPVIGAVNPNQYVQVLTSTGNQKNADGTVVPGYATPNSLTASIGGTFTANISSASPTTLNVTAILTGSLQVSDVISGTDGTNSLAFGCEVVEQLTGTAGGIGTYEIGFPPIGGQLNSCTVTSASTILNATAVTEGQLQPGQVLSDSGALAPGTMITEPIFGATGGVGLYSLSHQQTVPSELMTGSLTILAQVQPMSGGDLHHFDMLNLQGSRRTLYANVNLRGIVRVKIRGGDLVILPDNSRWLVEQIMEPFFDTAGWQRVIIRLQDGS